MTTADRGRRDFNSQPAILGDTLGFNGQALFFPTKERRSRCARQKKGKKKKTATRTNSTKIITFRLIYELLARSSLLPLTYIRRVSALPMKTKIDRNEQEQGEEQD